MSSRSKLEQSAMSKLSFRCSNPKFRQKYSINNQCGCIPTPLIKRLLDWTSCLAQF